jgi:hypothetical protein
VIAGSNHNKAEATIVTIDQPRSGKVSRANSQSRPLSQADAGHKIHMMPPAY